MKYGLGVDIGGTKVAAVIINQAGKIIRRSELPSKPDDKEGMFEQVTKTIDRLFSEAEFDISMVSGLGVGIPGRVDQGKGVAVFQNNLQWRNFPIVARLQNYYDIDNVVIDNDVYMAAFAEWKSIGAMDSDTFVYVTVSTGISCSIIQNGSFLRGAGFAGEIGLLPVAGQTKDKFVHRLEDTSSGPAIQRAARDRFKCPEMTTEAILKRYESESSEATSVLDGVIDELVRGVYCIICLLDPHQMVFGGGVINHHPFLLELVEKEINHYLIDEQKSALSRMHLSFLKGDSGAVGAGLKAIMNREERSY
ncbi:glucokinase [Virgibacillus siamensis]|uniref:Glucokinase n=1 Tax=Virgibacillus siamensis TaxID=480071 RepID=A0ABP3QI59_9BACI